MSNIYLQPGTVGAPTVEKTSLRATKVRTTKVKTALAFALTAAATLVTGHANAAFDIEGNTLLFTDDDWYQVQTTGTFVTICNGASSCTVASGDYIVINHTTGERWERVSVPETATEAGAVSGSETDNEVTDSETGDGQAELAITQGDLIIAGNLLSFATTDWFQVQQSADFQTVCEGVTSCLLEAGSYIVINHGTGTRYEDVLIGAAPAADSDSGEQAESGTDSGADSANATDGDANTDAFTAPGFDGLALRWPDDGWYQIQSSADFSTICEGGTACPVESGSYIIINLTTGQRWEDFNVQVGVPASVDGGGVAGSPVMNDTDDSGEDAEAGVEEETGTGGEADADSEPVSEGAVSDGEDGSAAESPGGPSGPTGDGSDTDETVVDNTNVPEMVASAAPVVEGNTIIMSGPGWFQVQSATDFTTICSGENRCDVPRGNYIVINHTTGERFENISVFNTAGVWFGTTSFGEGVFIIDAQNSLYGLSRRDDGIAETVFGDVDATIQRHLHVPSRNPDHGTSFNLLGERPENINIFDMNDVDYDLEVTNDGQSLVNSGIGGNFSLTFATVDDVKPISVLSIAGQWESRTAFCNIGCDLTMELEISNSGFVTGSSRVNDDMPGQLAGSAAAADNSNLYLQIEFLLNGDRRSGVVYFDRLTDALILNTVGVDAGVGSLAAVFERN